MRDANILLFEFTMASTPASKEFREQSSAFFGEHTRNDFDAMIELGMVHDLKHGTAGAGLGVGGGVDQARDAGVQDGSCTHGAGLQRDVEFAAGEPVVPEVLRDGAHGDDFGVSGGVAVANDAVLAAADDLAVQSDYGTDGNFAVGCGGACFRDGLANERLV